MTQRERLIVSAYTGVLMCDFDLVHKYIEEKLGHPVWTHELRFESTHAKIREKIKPDFIELCGNGDKHGAIADIVAEKRRRADEIERDVSAKMKSGEMVSDQYAREVIEDLRREADRIEAAAKREVEDAERCGNHAAKLREALISCRKKLANIKPGDFVAGVLIEVIATADAALAASADESEVGG